MQSSNNFKIVITAVDKATATVKKINDQFSRLVRPLNNIGRSTRMLGRELGLPKLASGIRGVATSVREVTREGMAFGLKLGGVMGAGAALVGALTTEWAHLAMEVTNAAGNIGSSARDVMAWRGAARAAGLEAAAFDGAAQALGDTLEDALFGRNQQALAMMNRLGLAIHRTADGSIDVTRNLMGISRAISNVRNAQAQGFIARSLGVEALLPLLRKGPGAISAYRREVARLGGVETQDAIRRADAFGVKLSLLHTAIGGARNAIGDKLIPVIQPLVQGLTEWIGKNRELIATNIAGYVKGIATWVSKIDFGGIMKKTEDLAGTVDRTVEKFGGWKVVAGGVAAVMAGPLLLAITNLGSALYSIGVFLTTTPLGLAIMSLVGGFALGTALYEAYDKLRYGDGTEQKPTPEGSYADTPGGAAAGRTYNRRSTNYVGDLPIDDGNYHSPPKLPSLVPPAISQGGGAGANATSGASGRVQVDVNFKNPPPGTRVETTSEGAADASARVGVSRPAWAT